MFNWNLSYAPNALCKNKKISSIADIENSEFEIIGATVPGNFELDLMREGKIEDLYYSTNTLQAQKLENLHLWYFCKFDVLDKNSYLHFAGIDTVSEIYINGKLVKTTDNMFIPYDVFADFNIGENEMVVHILPICIYARKYEVEPDRFALKYGFTALNIRKAPHMFGWDIMPRIVSAGIWKDVTLEKIKQDKIKDVYFTVNSIDAETNTANIRFCVNTEVSGDFITDYSIRIYGKCKTSEFDITEKLWNTGYQFVFNLPNAMLWMPKNYGEQNLYDTHIELICNNKVLDTYSLNIGIRTAELETSDSNSENEVGDFCFKINGQRIFAMGTNHVPLDALHSRDEERLDKALDMIDDLDCNIVRCWGGNVYESDRFFDFCDKHGIMVWQDFAMACASYPQTEEFADKIKEEAIYQIKRLRNHPSLVLWAGDNECDIAYRNWTGGEKKDPNTNIITRRVLKELTRTYDYSRPYLASSPFVSETAHKTDFPMPENHVWGPRDYFKSDFYKNAKCRFASETGYQGFPSPKSLAKFLKSPDVIFNPDGTPSEEYTVHAASPETAPDSPYAYRIGLTYRQIVNLFGSAENNFDDLMRQSQISQAEAKKYFIEKFRIKKWYCTGIVWWNLLDGWPQISDAVVDYYFTKKLAYHYIKRSQQPFCLMFDEPVNGKISLYAVNDTQTDIMADFTVTEMYSENKVLSSSVMSKANTSTKTAEIKTDGNNREFFLIEWNLNETAYKNHFCTDLLGTDYKKYLSAIGKCGFDEFEGFI